MVKISGYQERKSSDGKKTFIVLELEGDIQFLTSQATGNQYASVLKCTMPSTFDEETAQQLVGKTLPGSIEKTPCEPYDYANPTTGAITTLDYRYAYKAPENGLKQQEEVSQLKLKTVEVL